MTQFERVVLPTVIEPACPAAQRVAEAEGGTGAVCRITTDLIDSARDPSTLNRFCFNEQGYRTCPTWQADKREIWKTKTIKDLLTPKGDLTSGHPEDRERNQGLNMALEAQERDRWLTEREQQTT